MTTEILSPAPTGAAFLEPRLEQLELALLIAAIVFVAGDPAAAAGGVLLARAASRRPLVAVAAVVNAWGRYNGGLLVAPAIALLFVMNIFPLLWSFGLSFFAYRANRQRRRASSASTTTRRCITDPDRLGAPAHHGDPRGR